MKNLINTISKELNANNLYLNHCSAEIQLLRACKGLTSILNLKPLNSLKRIVNELLATKQEQADKMSNDFELLIEQEQEQQRIEINPNFEKANSQIIEKYESKNENELAKNLVSNKLIHQNQVNFFTDIIQHIS